MLPTYVNIKPLANHLFIEQIEAETMTKSGIYIPESAENKPTTGKVVAVGEGKINEKGERTPMSVKIGDTVLYKKYGLSEVEIDGKKYMVGDEDDILAVLE
ncbi:MAG: 10 kDa chaperonin [Candidatus Wolfebacteria bacterium GW2011_GWC2_39_22]|uniref:Co-chaperonin GroES n=2 Tax=Candidatus Wolfeibacteriota TaxID=1752735 RepID=A0A0G1K4H9_9BACT|nr:MAG: 10 kDa chaperonin [Candidatus Wolfebacteria bacterium GW2011_GWC2_39_22]KKT42739.1 MAG: 10 kDa chaperonin [Candidatus Wolfebacteria bacterium GW2011_GWE2_44_13]HBI26058.1 co-chaperone GroES [Candidatus Wolfebacteria bacterium]